MSVHNFRAEQAAALKSLAVAATRTLTVDELQEYGVFVCTTTAGIVLTLPAASEATKGIWFFANILTNNLTIVLTDTAKYGGGGASEDTVTLTRGDLGIVVGDGTNYHGSPAPT